MSIVQERAISTKLDRILGLEFKVLDKGFVRVVDYMGNDSSVVQAARVSYGAGTKSTNTDKALINYLMRHQHNTPFEMAVIKFHVKLPIFVARQWMRHRSSFNEISARYSQVQDEFYLPDIKDIKVQSSSNHQGRDEELNLDVLFAEQIANKIDSSKNTSYNTYSELLEKNIARELARTTLPVSQYTEFYWTVNLRNLLHFLKLRCDSHAQFEIREYADQILDIIKYWVPDSLEAFINYSMNAETLSEKAIQVINKYLREQILINQEESGLSKREYEELVGSSIFAGITYPVFAK